MRSIPEDNLAFPTLLTFDTGYSGSGFLLSGNNKIYLITAKHVLFDQNMNIWGQQITLLIPTKDINDESKYILSINLQTTPPIYHSSADVASIELGATIADPDGNGSNLIFNPGIEVLKPGNTPMVWVGSKGGVKLLKDVLVSNDVFLYGYPTSLGIKDMPQFDYSKPLLRKGIIASVNQGQGTIIIDCPVYYGNSGGPVIEVDGSSHRVIGVVVQLIPFVEQWINTKNKLVNEEWANSGYSVVVSMDKVFELVGIQAGELNDISSPLVAA